MRNMFMIAALATAAGGQTQLAEQYIDMNTGSSFSGIYLSPSTITGEGPTRTAVLVFVNEKGAFGPKYDFDCVGRRYRVSGSSEAWSTDDPAGVDALCTKQFGDRESYNKVQLRQIVGAAMGKPLVRTTITARDKTCYADILKRHTWIIAEEQKTGSLEVTYRDDARIDRPLPSSQYRFASQRRSIGSEIAYSFDRKVTRDGLTETAQWVPGALISLGVQMPSVTKDGQPVMADVTLRVGKWAKPISTVTGSSNRHRLYALLKPEPGQSANDPSILSAADVGAIEQVTQGRQPLVIEVREAKGELLYLAELRYPDVATLRPERDRVIAAVLKCTDKPK